MSDLADLIARVEGAKSDDWRLNAEVINALGGVVRRVTKLGINGRTKGSERVFWEGGTSRDGKRVPNFLADDKAKARAVKRLRSLQAGAQN